MHVSGVQRVKAAVCEDDRSAGLLRFAPNRNSFVGAESLDAHVLQRPLGRGDAFYTRVRCDSFSERPRDGLENRFEAVVRVRPPNEIDVKVDPSVIGEAAEELFAEFAGERANRRFGNFRRLNEIGTARTVDGHPGQRFIHRDGSRSKPRYPRLVP